jgi:hypothetical protein
MDVHFNRSMRTRSGGRDRPDFMVLIVFLWRATSCGVCGSKRGGACEDNCQRRARERRVDCAYTSAHPRCIRAPTRAGAARGRVTLRPPPGLVHRTRPGRSVQKVSPPRPLQKKEGREEKTL